MEKMKFFHILSASACILVVSLAFQSNTDEGSVGDVKYSVLPLAQFQSLNGSGWVELKGQKIDPNWRIKTLTTFAEPDNLPDARGVFIRTIDSGAGRDPDQSRAIGSFQNDSFKAHQHKYVGAIYHPSDRLEGDVTWRRVDPFDGETSLEGGPETRPKNIVLYTYIKVN